MSMSRFLKGSPEYNVETAAQYVGDQAVSDDDMKRKLLISYAKEKLSDPFLSEGERKGMQANLNRLEKEKTDAAMNKFEKLIEVVKRAGQGVKEISQDAAGVVGQGLMNYSRR